MGNLKIKTGPGDCFDQVAKKAKESASNEPFSNVEFDFNGVLCIVTKDTNLDYLFRDYTNSWTMNWKVVGPDCVKEYPLDVQIELDARNKANYEKSKQEAKKQTIKDDNEKQQCEEKVIGISMEFKDEEVWKTGLAKNADPYGACCYEFAEMWARLMQAEIATGKTVIDCAKTTSHQLGYLGITGFMYGAAVSILSHCWLHGEELRKWHNKDYGHEGEGVVNPAILSIKIKE